MRSLGWTAALLVAAPIGAGCGDDDDDVHATDAGVEPDAAFDAGGSLDASLFEPAAPELPALAPCPTGWREVPADAPGEPAICDPWPAAGRQAECADGEAHFPGEPDCRAVGDPCPADDWPEGLPGAATVVYVRAGEPAGGDGTLERPLATIADALEAAPDGAVVAIAKGRYPEVARVTKGLTLWGACAAETVLEPTGGPEATFAVQVVAPAGTTVTVRNLHLAGDGGALLGLTGSFVVRGVVAEGSRVSSFLVYSDEYVLEDVVARRPMLSALAMLGSGTVTAHRVVVEEPGDQAVVAGGGQIDVTDMAVVRAGSSGVGSECLRVWQQGTLRVERAIVQDTDAAAVSASEESTLELTDVVLLRNAGGAASLPDGVTVLEASTAHLRRVRLESPFGAGVFVAEPGSRAELEDVLVRDVRPVPAAQSGRGVSVEAGASLQASRTLVEGATDIGFMATDDATATLSDVTIRDTRSTADGVFGRGLQVQVGAQVTAERLRVERAREAAIVAAGAGALAELRDASIHDTLERDCAQTTCRGFGGGVGLGAYLDGALWVEGFSIGGSALAGVQIAREGAIDLHLGTVRDCPVGVNLQVPDYDVARLTDRVAFVDDGVALDSDSLPTPDLGP